ncbi:MFS transporter [Leifsonia aquatica]|uniref:MFS transporter n=1 Tax=Leifsonia aquatica TaxID=144185 RepID=UPI0004686EF3|nr:MFS transporter [Leifsonia aquatica]
MSSRSVADTPVAAARARKVGWPALIVISLAQLMVVLDATIVNIALLKAALDLQFDASGRQWIVAAYSLAFGALLLVGGRLGDRVGNFRTFVVGAAGFAVASALGGWAPTFGILVGARAAQGAFAALLAPAALSLLTVSFAGSSKRDRAFAIFGAVSGAGAGIGLILGGWLADAFSWRATLYINVLFALVAIIGAFLVLPRPKATTRAPFDFSGAIVSAVGLFGIVYAIATISSQPIPAGIALLVGIVLLIVFAKRQRRIAAPLLPPSVLADRRRSTSSLVMLIASISIVAAFVFATSYLQEILGFTPLLAGLAFLPMVVAVVIGAQVISAGLAARVSLKVKVPVAALVSAIGMVLLAQVHDGTDYVSGILPGLIVTGLGLGVIFASTIAAATLDVAPEDAGAASAVLNSAQQLGTSVGVAVLTAASGVSMGLYIANHLVPVGTMGSVPSTHTIEIATIVGYQGVFLVAAAAFVATGTVALIRYPRRHVEPSAH